VITWGHVFVLPPTAILVDALFATAHPEVLPVPVAASSRLITLYPGSERKGCVAVAGFYLFYLLPPAMDANPSEGPRPGRCIHIGQDCIFIYNFVDLRRAI
jgi:hypothetical protein